MKQKPDGISICETERSAYWGSAMEIGKQGTGTEQLKLKIFVSCFGPQQNQRKTSSSMFILYSDSRGYDKIVLKKSLPEFSHMVRNGATNKPNLSQGHVQVYAFFCFCFFQVSFKPLVHT